MTRALRQTVLPIEIIIVDASENWLENRDAVIAHVGEDLGAVSFVYEQAKVRSTTHQRNQALEHLTADIVFAIDDDSLMFDDCAEKVLRVYEADRSGRVAMVGARAARVPPGTTHERSSGVPGGRTTSPPFGVRRFVRRLLRPARKQVHMDRLFVPYTRYKRERVPGELRHLPVVCAHLLNGFCTTFRRRFGERVRWPEVLRFYALYEDADFSHRMSEHGLILRATDAFLFHAQEGAGRLSPATTRRLGIANLIVLHRIYSPSRRRSYFRLLTRFTRLAAIYTVLDPLRGRWSLPTVRAFLADGILKLPYFLLRNVADPIEWYADVQRRIVQPEPNDEA